VQGDGVGSGLGRLRGAGVPGVTQDGHDDEDEPQEGRRQVEEDLARAHLAR
jgi:hypothetical protein